MDAKEFVALVFQGLNPQQKIVLACAVLYKDVTQYDHLDSGRKSMTAGNMLRNALNKDPLLQGKVREEAKKVAGMDIAAAPTVNNGAPKESKPKPVLADGEWPFKVTFGEMCAQKC